MCPGKFVDLGHLGFCHFTCIYATNALSARVNMQHHLRGPLAIHREKCFQDHDDKVHRGEIVIENHHLIHRRLRHLRRRHLDGDAVMVIVFVLWTLWHEFDVMAMSTPSIGCVDERSRDATIFCVKLRA